MAPEVIACDENPDATYDNRKNNNCKVITQRRSIELDMGRFIGHIVKMG